MRGQLLLYRQHLLERLHSVSEDITRVVGAIVPGQWHTIGVNGKSPHYILAHMRVVEAQAFYPRLQRILDEIEPFLPLFDDKKWMEEHYDPGEPPEDILAQYIALRDEELAWLKNLSIQDWNRTGRHPWWGRRALQWWVEQVLRFSEEHLQQLNLTSGK